MISILRKELYALVWSEPLTTLAKRFGISNLQIEKICKSANIPLPKAGHWMKIKYGKKVIQLELPVNGENNSDEIINLQQSEAKVRTLATKNELESTIKISKRLAKPVDLVIETQNNLMDKNGRHHNHNGLIVNVSGLDIKVSTKYIPRALRFWDILIKSLQSRGHIVRINHRNTIVEIKGVNFDLFLRECTNRELNPKKEYSWNEYLYTPNGIFAFRIDRLKEWKDGKILIENKLPEIIVALELDAEETIERRRRLEEEHFLRAEKVRIALEIKNQQDKELANFKELLNQSERWDKVVILRKYLDEVESRSRHNNSLTDSVLDWLKWARDKADWYDPFVEKEDELLKTFNKENFEL